MRRLWLGMVAALMVAALPAAAHVPRSAAAPAATLVVDAPPAVTTLTIEDDGTQNNGVFRITGDDGFSPMTVSGYANVVVRGGDGAERITVVELDPADPDGPLPQEALTSITLDGDSAADNDTGNDTLHLGSLPASVSATLLGGAGNDILQVSSLGEAGGAVRGPVFADGESHLSQPTATYSAGCVGRVVTRVLVVGDELAVGASFNLGEPTTYSLSPTALERTAAGESDVTFAGVERANYSVPGAITVTGTPASSLVNIYESLAGSIPEVGVEATGTESVLRVLAGGGADDVHIDSTGAGSVTLIHGDNEGDTITYNGNGPDSGTLIQGNAGDDTLSILGTSPGSATAVEGNAGNDTIHVAPGQQGTVCGEVPTGVAVTGFWAARSGSRVVLRWRTASETDAVGFNLYRNGRRINHTQVRAKRAGRPVGEVYRYVDTRAQRPTLRYQLQLVRSDGSLAWAGSVRVS